MSFGSVSEQYAEYRPGPPPETLDVLLPPSATAVIDVGAGTGNLTRLLVDRVDEVTAIEPDPRMRSVLAQRVPSARVLAGTAECLPVGDASQDAVLASSAWHWVDVDLAALEAARALRPGGRLGAVWTSADRTQGWIDDLWRRMRPLAPTAQAGRARRGLRLPAGAPFGPVQGPHAVCFSRRFTIEQLVGLVGTYSAVITLPHDERMAFLRRLGEELAREPLLNDPAGIELPMRAECWYCERL